MDVIEDRVAGVLAGAAVGDALGGATEGWTTDQIRERHGGRVTGIVGPFLPDWRTARPIAPYHKGDGHGLGGRAAVPSEWVRDVTRASRLDLEGVIRTMAGVVRDVAEADARRAREKAAMLDALLDGALL